MKVSKVSSVLDERFSIRPHNQSDMGFHSHSFFELVYVTGGSAIHMLENGEEWKVSEGDFFIIDYGTDHCYRDSRDCTLINCLFLPEIIHESLADCHAFDEILRYCLMRYYRQLLGDTPVNRIFHDENGWILELLNHMQDEYDRKQLGYEEVFHYSLMEIVICMVRKLVAEDKLAVQEKSYSDTVTKMIAFLSVHYNEKNVLTDFCEENHYSMPYISRCFKAETGLTVQKYIQKIRIEKSCELLLGTNLPIQQIAHEVGYEDTKFYHQLFRRMLDMSPREYRKKLVGL